MSPKTFRHYCPAVEALIDEACTQILQCRCFDSVEFFEAQDAVAVYLDCVRSPAEQ